jgi:16S rRNA C967 or C1407 C5-methylase (RsmB/RsmF family)
LNANEVLNGINHELDLNEALKTSQLWPHKHATDAMFLALFRKSVG